MCFADLDEQAQHDLAVKCTRQTLRTFVEMGAYWYWPGDKLMNEFVEKMSGREHIEAALAKGKGIIFAAPHLGAWEMLTLWWAHEGNDIVALYRPPRMEALDASVRKSRQRTGARLAPATAKGIKALYSTLKNGGVTAILPDQEPSPKAGVFAPFFGIQTLTMTLMHRMIQKTGAPVLLVVAERLASGKYHLQAIPVGEGIMSEDPVEHATALNAAIEKKAREIPDQYLWSYKRFHKRPEGGVSPYKSQPK